MCGCGNVQNAIAHFNSTMALFSELVWVVWCGENFSLFVEYFIFIICCFVVEIQPVELRIPTYYPLTKETIGKIN